MMKKIFLSLFLFASATFGQNVNDKLIRVRELVMQARVHGLQNSWYLSSAVETQIQQLMATGQVAGLDALLNSIADRLAKDIYRGRVTPDKVQTKARITLKAFPHADKVNQFLNNQLQASQLLIDIQPKHNLYLQAQGVLNRLESLKAQSLWTTRPATLKIARAELNVKNPSLVKYLRLKLKDFGYVNDISKIFFDDELKIIAQRFQTDHNLAADGIIGNISWSFLERNLDQLITQAVLNIDRVRWLPDDMTSNYVFVNLAQQRLQLFENYLVTMDFKTINGRLDRQTPMLVDRLRGIVLNPTWTVPYSIFMKDKLPVLKTDPTYLTRNNMQAVDDETGQAHPNQDAINWNLPGVESKYTIVQKPGPGNALGFIKFPLSNAFAIYLHDTSDRPFFAKDLRLLSSGCVRLSQPFEFAEKVLADPKWTLDSLKNFTEFAPVIAEVPTNLSRKTSLPVYLFYQTLFQEADGRLITLNDHYEIDKLVFPLMAK